MNLQNYVTFSLSSGPSTLRFVPALIIITGCSVRADQTKMHSWETSFINPDSQAGRMCVSSLNCFAAFKRTVRGTTLHILVLHNPSCRNLDTFLLLLLLLLWQCGYKPLMKPCVFSLLRGWMQKRRNLCVSQHLCLSLRIYWTPLWDR